MAQACYAKGINKDCMRKELARLATHGGQQYMSSMKYKNFLQQLGNAHVSSLAFEDVAEITDTKFFKKDGEPSGQFKAHMRKHPHALEIVTLVACKALAMLPRDVRVDDSGTHLPHMSGAIMHLCHNFLQLQPRLLYSAVCPWMVQSADAACTGTGCATVLSQPVCRYHAHAYLFTCMYYSCHFYVSHCVIHH